MEVLEAGILDRARPVRGWMAEPGVCFGKMASVTESGGDSAYLG